MSASHIDTFLAHFVKLKMFHFQTKSAFAHTKVDLYTAKFLVNLDTYFEVWQGESGRLKDRKIKLEVEVATDESFRIALQEFVDFLVGLDAEGLPLTLAPVRDQMAADAKQLMYLLTFK